MREVEHIFEAVEYMKSMLEWTEFCRIHKNVAFSIRLLLDQHERDSQLLDKLLGGDRYEYR